MRRSGGPSTWRDDPAFQDDPTAVVVLDRELVIRAVNPAYEKATGFTEDELMSRFVFDAFPANPDDPDDDGQGAMAASFEQVLRDPRGHDLVVQRYDIPDTTDRTRFVPKVWAPRNVPVWNGDDLVGVACRVDELRLPVRALRAIAPLRDQLRRAASSEDPETVLIVETVAWGLREYAAALGEVEHLRAALTSRATIDQAKGVLMAEHHCSSDEAFRLLVRLSNDTNVKLADVASALIYQAQAGRTSTAAQVTRSSGP